MHPQILIREGDNATLAVAKCEERCWHIGGSKTLNQKTVDSNISPTRVSELGICVAT